ncbi:hypothetical protein [Rhodococcus qingshengii]|uniref:hypothetical protein n=1 Tax=Rhodococcus qingshengii TaxID=334542 RepID=UPI00210B787F|nr:hypothetical protein [Rhodococcus qingshengii]MCQ4148566.1 hypothetical protein [Rhodococcus qingshengii]
MGFTADMADGLAPTEYSVSVFAKRRRADETVSEFVERACIELRGARNSQWVALVPESDLVDAGFRIELNEPPVDHYDIPVGSSEEMLRVDELSAVFGRYERRKVSK